MGGYVYVITRARVHIAVYVLHHECHCGLVRLWAFCVLDWRLFQQHLKEGTQQLGHASHGTEEHGAEEHGTEEHVTHHASHVTRHTSHVTRHTSP